MQFAPVAVVFSVLPLADTFNVDFYYVYFCHNCQCQFKLFDSKLSGNFSLLIVRNSNFLSTINIRIFHLH